MRDGDREDGNAEELKEGVDYYCDENGNLVFTEGYHSRRGYCCQSGCRHCPFGYRKVD